MWHWSHVLEFRSTHLSRLTRSICSALENLDKIKCNAENFIFNSATASGFEQNAVSEEFETTTLQWLFSLKASAKDTWREVPFKQDCNFCYDNLNINYLASRGGPACDHNTVATMCAVWRRFELRVSTYLAGSDGRSPRFSDYRGAGGLHSPCCEAIPGPCLGSRTA